MNQESEKRIRILIADDESEAREGIKVLLARDLEVELVDVCKNGLEAIAAVQRQQPDIILLDIQMPEINGFEVLNSLPADKRPAVIFITAYDQYALRAFEVHAVDYLLKPFTDARFFEALNRSKTLIRQHTPQSHARQIQQLLDAQQASRDTQPGTLISQRPAALTDRLIIKAEGRIHFLPLDDILWIGAFDYYVKIHRADGFFMVRETMKNMENQLPADLFMRIHKSSIVNLRFIRDLAPYFHGEYLVNLTNGQQLKLSKTYRSKLLGYISGNRNA